MNICKNIYKKYEHLQKLVSTLTLSLLMLHICGVSKTFGKWYQKTNKTEDTNKLHLLAFKIIIILHNTSWQRSWKMSAFICIFCFVCFLVSFTQHLTHTTCMELFVKLEILTSFISKLSCGTVVCKHFASYQGYPNYRWDITRYAKCLNIWIIFMKKLRKSYYFVFLFAEQNTKIIV
jgi:hypothetical protein